ncbi:MAG: hypothetical protein HY056_14490 [Proteobacteria bacterium]|nr:hypothetical protein [Pseudomonadota bacterium]
MSWTYEIALHGAPDMHAAMLDWVASGSFWGFTALPGLASFDLYTAAQGPARDPFNHDGAGPPLLLLDFASRDTLDAAIRQGHLAAAVALLPRGLAATGAALERRFYPVGDDTAPAPLDAPFSYVVRYRRPADDEAAFNRNYLATHPATQAKLPGIRAIMCYLPLDDLQTVGVQCRAHGLAGADYLIGNEVVFDDIAAFNGAMASPVRQELRAHFHEFPRLTGAITHYPMTRRRLVG